MHGADIAARSPIDGSVLASLRADDAGVDRRQARARRSAAFRAWRDVPAPRRGELVAPVRRGSCARNKDALGALVTLESGKILQEGLRRSAGDDRHLRLRRRPVAPALRPDDRVRAARPSDDGDVASARASVGVISAFNFPVAVWAWNARSRSCAATRSSGSRRRRRRSPRSPCQRAVRSALARQCRRRAGGAVAGRHRRARRRRAARRAIRASPLVSRDRQHAHGPRRRARVAAQRLGAHAARARRQQRDDRRAVGAISISRCARSCSRAVGTAGQRCTSLRRLIVHEVGLRRRCCARLKASTRTLPIGDPLEDGTLVGPLIDAPPFERMQQALARARRRKAARVQRRRARRRRRAATAATTCGRRSSRCRRRRALVHTETFAPILYVLRYRDFDEAIALHNAVPQGLVVVRSSPTTCARPSASCRPPAATAASPT